MGNTQVNNLTLFKLFIININIKAFICIIMNAMGIVMHVLQQLNPVKIIKFF